MYTSRQFNRADSLFRRLTQVEQESAVDSMRRTFFITKGLVGGAVALEYITYGELHQPLDYFRVHSPSRRGVIVVLRNPAFYKRKATEVVLVDGPDGTVASKLLLGQYLQGWEQRL